MLACYYNKRYRIIPIQVQVGPMYHACAYVHVHTCNNSLTLFKCLAASKYLLCARDILTVVADGIKDSVSLCVAEYLAIVADRNVTE